MKMLGLDVSGDGWRDQSNTQGRCGRVALLSLGFLLPIIQYCLTITGIYSMKFTQLEDLHFLKLSLSLLLIINYFSRSCCNSTHAEKHYIQVHTDLHSNTTTESALAGMKPNKKTLRHAQL